MTSRSLEILIDEVVLGLASDEDVARLEALIARDRAIAAQLEQARQKFAPLDDTAETLPLPKDFWNRLAPQLDTAKDAGADAVESASPPVSNVIQLDSLRTRATRWRGAALGAMAASLLMACVLGWSLTTTPEPLIVAVLVDDAGDAVALIESGSENTTRVTLLERPDVPPNQVMQVWTKPDDDGPPVSLGLLTSGSSMTLTVDGLPVPQARQLYEITAEPAGGSPTNLPTGPILGKGLAKEPVI